MSQIDFHRYETILYHHKVINLTTYLLIPFLLRLNYISNKQAASLAGLAPINRDSGTKFGKRFINGGRKQLRNALYMASLAAIRYNYYIKDFYSNLVANNKPFKIAAADSMRKLIILANSLIKNNRAFV